MLCETTVEPVHRRLATAHPQFARVILHAAFDRETYEHRMTVQPGAIERVRDDCTRRGFDVKIGGELFSDAMGNPGQHPGYAVET